MQVQSEKLNCDSNMMPSINNLQNHLSYFFCAYCVVTIENEFFFSEELKTFVLTRERKKLFLCHSIRSWKNFSFMKNLANGQFLIKKKSVRAFQSLFYHHRTKLISFEILPGVDYSKSNFLGPRAPTKLEQANVPSDFF